MSEKQDTEMQKCDLCDNLYDIPNSLVDLDGNILAVCTQCIYEWSPPDDDDSANLEDMPDWVQAWMNSNYL